MGHSTNTPDTQHRHHDVHLRGRGLYAD